MPDDRTPDAIPPALTPEEWAHAKKWASPRIHCDASGYIYGGAESALHHDQTPSPIVLDERPHALAALALHGQPFGPKAEWPRELREMARWVGDECDADASADLLREVAAFLDALLPPEGT